jgi:hypothetical protein
MSNKEHRLGVSEVNLVVRHLTLEPVEQNQIQALITDINRLYGMDAISFDEKSHVLNLAYDASRLCLDGIEGLFKQHDVEVSHDWWTHFKKATIVLLMRILKTMPPAIHTVVINHPCRFFEKDNRGIYDVKAYR